MTTRRILAVGVLCIAGAAASAADLPRLRDDQPLPAGEGSPGTVTFRHSSHVDPAQPRCGACHPRLFRMLETAATADGTPIRHQAMEQGRQCGACHGKGAFGFDGCDACHQ